MKAVRGTRSLSPTNCALRDRILTVCNTVAKSFLYEPVDIPTLEYAELFSRTLGEGSDVILKEMYTFPDRKETNPSLLALRPEGTAGVMRMHLAERRTLPQPQRYYYSGKMYRYERPQKGRLREFTQFGIEAIGSDSVSTDVEAIASARDVLEALDIVIHDGVREGTKLSTNPANMQQPRVKLLINCLGNAASRTRYRDALASYLDPYFNDLSLLSRERLQRGSVLRILDSKEDNDAPIVAGAPSLLDFLSPESQARFSRVLECLQVMEVPFNVSPRLVRGLDYYDETVFEFVTVGDANASGQERSQNAVLAGGRYNGLSKLLGGPALPAVGWAMGVDRVMLLMADQSSLHFSNDRIGVAVVRSNTQQSNKQRRGKAVVHQWDGNLSKQLRRAEALGARASVLVGEDELQRDCVVWKDFTTGTQEELPLKTFIHRIDETK